MLTSTAKEKLVLMFREAYEDYKRKGNVRLIPIRIGETTITIELGQPPPIYFVDVVKTLQAYTEICKKFKVEYKEDEAIELLVRNAFRELSLPEYVNIIIEKLIPYEVYEKHKFEISKIIDSTFRKTYEKFELSPACPVCSQEAIPYSQLQEPIRTYFHILLGISEAELTTTDFRVCPELHDHIFILDKGVWKPIHFRNARRYIAKPRTVSTVGRIETEFPLVGVVSPELRREIEEFLREELERARFLRELEYPKPPRSLADAYRQMVEIWGEKGAEEFWKTLRRRRII